jgi:hypothetical protein
MSDEGNAAEAKELSRGLQAIRGVRFRGAAPIAPTGWVIEKEAPWHLSAAYMYAMGSCNSEIAKAHDKSPQAVSNLFHQPFFQERVTAIMAENRRDVMDLFKDERINSLMTLVAIRDNENAPPVARVQAARDILDRAMGRPAQRIETVNEVRSDNPVAECAMLEAEIRQLSKNTFPAGSEANNACSDGR